MKLVRPRKVWANLRLQTLVITLKCKWLDFHKSTQHIAIRVANVKWKPTAFWLTGSRWSPAGRDPTPPRRTAPSACVAPRCALPAASLGRSLCSSAATNAEVSPAPAEYSPFRSHGQPQRPSFPCRTPSPHGWAMLPATRSSPTSSEAPIKYEKNVLLKCVNYDSDKSLQ